MFDYLQKFKTLPQELRDVVSSPRATKAIAHLEQQYGIGLDVLVVKIMTKDVPWQAVPEVLHREHNLSLEQVNALHELLAREVFAPVSRYLGIAAMAPPQDEPVASEEQPTEAATVAAEAAEEQAETEELHAMQQKVDTLQDHVATAPEPAAPSAEQMLQEVGLEANEDNIRRLEKITHTFHKGIRDAIDTKETIKKPLTSGGLGLAEAQAATLMAHLRRGKKATAPEEHSQPAPQEPAAAMPSVDTVRDVEYAFPQGQDVANKAATPTQPQAEGYHTFTADELEHELAPPPPAISNAPQPAPAPAAQPPTKKPPEAQEPTAPLHISKDDVEHAQAKDVKKAAPQPDDAKQPVAVRVQRERVQPADDRPRVQDVTRPQKRTQGPLDELLNMNLATFRRLGENPAACAQKVRNMVNVIGQEGIPRKQEAVRMWRQSPLYRQYVRLGQLSFSQGRPVEAIITEEKNNGGSVLTPDEFNAILELNGALRV